jgi:phosphate transport system substrate-binding protein
MYFYTLFPASSNVHSPIIKPMKTYVLTVALALSAAFLLSCCAKDEMQKFSGIENITFENYPRVDGSTSSSLLNTMVACKMLGISYRWLEPGLTTEWMLYPVFDEIPGEHKNFFYERIRSSKTHGAFMNLINGEADIILVHRRISPDEKAYADSAGVTLIETPIASDAFVFIVNKSNPIKTLTVSQIQKIYTGEITSWSQVGGKSEDMKVFTRPRNSGSEEVFRQLVMKDLEPAEFTVSQIGGMLQVFSEITYNNGGICYTFLNYKKLQARIPQSEVPVISVNGIFPENKTIRNKTYPFITEVYVAIRSDLDRNSMAYKLYEWLQSENAKQTITDCGFLPK